MNESRFAEQVAGCSGRTQQLLIEAGWFLERFVDITKSVKALEAEQYTVFPVVQRFLHSFDGLYVEWFSVDICSNIDLHTSLWIDGAEAAGSLFPEWQSDYEAFLGTSLCPIGAAENGHFTLLMDEQEKVYGVFDESIVLLGETGVQAIDTFITVRKGTVLRK